VEGGFSGVRAEDVRLASCTAQGKPQARRTPFMSIFRTKVIVATDGSEETL
jgi:hypothetical protein